MGQLQMEVRDVTTSKNRVVKVTLSKLWSITHVFKPVSSGSYFSEHTHDFVQHHPQEAGVISESV